MEMPQDNSISFNMIKCLLTHLPSIGHASILMIVDDHSVFTSLSISDQHLDNRLKSIPVLIFDRGMVWAKI
jgi:hypothetical protein